MHWSTCNTEWRLERCKYTDLHVAHSEEKNGVDTVLQEAQSEEE
jgi:hypothetical protein